jgi:hypothetical protein
MKESDQKHIGTSHNVRLESLSDTRRTGKRGELVDAAVFWGVFMGGSPRPASAEIDRIPLPSRAYPTFSVFICASVLMNLNPLGFVRSGSVSCSQPRARIFERKRGPW